MDREKLIEALDKCYGQPETCGVSSCPYWDLRHPYCECEDRMRKDAIALLKENEPHIAWRNAKIDKPESGDVVLAVKENKAGRRSICLATWYKDRDWADGWVTTGGNNNVIYWTPLPKIPEK